MSVNNKDLFHLSPLDISSPSQVESTRDALSPSTDMVAKKRSGGILKRIEKYQNPINITSLKWNIPAPSPIDIKDKIIDFKIPKKKNGGILKRAETGIHIKEKNEGKFTESAKRAGMGVQEYAHKIMKDPDATPLQKKRANFAIQAKKWKK